MFISENAVKFTKKVLPHDMVTHVELFFARIAQIPASDANGDADDAALLCVGFGWCTMSMRDHKDINRQRLLI